MLRPLLHKADFERVLAAPTRSRSAHFAVHHVDGAPAVRAWQPKGATAQELSTSAAPVVTRSVDDLPGGHWLGTVVPKRHARRAVTRNLLKRQIRAVAAAQGSALPPGLWVVRLKAPFVTSQFPSAASPALRDAARAELQALLQRLSAGA